MGVGTHGLDLHAKFEGWRGGVRVGKVLDVGGSYGRINDCGRNTRVTP